MNTAETSFSPRARAPAAQAPAAHPPAAHVSTRSQIATMPRKIGFALAALLVPAGAALLGARRSRVAAAIAGGASAALLLAGRWQLQRMIHPEPAFEVERWVGAIEIRRYLPMVEATTQTDGDLDHGLEEGFHRLAAYIFANDLAMTAPVLAGTGPDAREVAFVMPPGRARDSLPVPPGGVKLVERGARRIAVLGFRGRYDHDTVAKRAQRLLAMVDVTGLIAVGDPVFAGFDPPSTLPWLRRNEIWIDLA